MLKHKGKQRGLLSSILWAFGVLFLVSACSNASSTNAEVTNVAATNTTNEKMEITKNPDTNKGESDFVVQDGRLVKYTGKDEHIVLPPNVKEIVYGAFTETKTIKTLTTNEDLEIIGEGAFSGCENLKTVKLNQKLKIIGDLAFAYCEKLDIIIMNGANIKEIGENAFWNCKSLKTITFNKGLKKIGEYAFADCTRLKTVVFQKGLKKIKVKTFKGCKNLQTVRLPEGLLKLELSAFMDCKKLKSIKLPKSLRCMDGAFINCKSIKKINIPANVKKIDYCEFENCSNLSKFTVDKSNPYFTSKGGVLYNKKRTRLLSYPPTKKGKSFKVPKGVKEIDEGAFSNSKYLVELIIPSSVRDIPPFMIAGCKKLKKLKLEDGIKYAVQNAFSDCKSIEEITIPASMTLGEIDLVFSGSTRLKKILVDEKNKYYRSVDGVLYAKD